MPRLHLLDVPTMGRLIRRLDEADIHGDRVTLEDDEIQLLLALLSPSTHALSDRPFPAAAFPDGIGWEAYIDVLAGRVQRGESLWHPDDPPRPYPNAIPDPPRERQAGKRFAARVTLPDGSRKFLGRFATRREAESAVADWRATRH